MLDKQYPEVEQKKPLKKKTGEGDSDAEKELFVSGLGVSKDEKDQLCDSSSWDSQADDYGSDDSESDGDKPGPL